MRNSPDAKASEIPLKKAPAKREKETIEKEDEREDEKKERRELEEIDDAIAKCRSLLGGTNLFSEKTIEKYEKNWEELRQQRNVDWMREGITFLVKTIEQAESYHNMFARKMQEAVEKEWISKESAERWWNRFHNPDTLELARKAWVLEEFEPMVDRWKAVAEDRDGIEALLKEQKLTAKDIPELATILNKKAFLSLHYLSRKDRIAQAKALIKAYQLNKLSFIRYIEGELQECVRDGSLHSSKVGRWMQRAMESKDPNFALKLLEWIQNWRDVRTDFNKLNIAMQKGIPRGLKPASEYEFLLMNYKQRTSYCALAWIRLENAQEEDKKLANRKLKIRYNLDSKDWEGAEIDLTAALREWPDNRELVSMKTFLECHRPKKEDAKREKKESKNPMELLSSLRTMLSRIQGELHPMYAEALLAGPAVFECFLQLNDNNKWVHDHGFANEASDMRNAEDRRNKAMTQTYMKNGHSDEREENIVDGETAAEQAIRDDCTKSQSLYVGGQGREAVMRKVRANADNMGFRYWTRIVPKNTSYALHASYIENLHYPMKSALRELDRMGYRFTLSGRAEAKAGRTVEASTYAMAG